MTHAYRFVVGAAVAGTVISVSAGRDVVRADALFAFTVNVASIEELYAAVNDPENAGARVVMAPGEYALSAIDPNNIARPNGGRLELQKDMGLQGAVGDRSAVVIDAAALPQGSFLTQVSVGLPPSNTGAIRMGRGSNSVEWLTISNAFRGQAGIETDLLGTGPAYIRIEHIASTGHNRGIDVRNFGPSAAGRVIVANIVDNHLYGNTTGLGEGIRIVNIQGANAGRITARLSGNRAYGNKVGLLVANNRSNLAEISVLSTGDQFFENGAGTIIVGGLSSNATAANGNAITFEARGSRFDDNNGFTDFDRGGLVVLGGENTSIQNGTSNNTVNVVLHGCRMEGNQIRDLGVFGARSAPSSIGLPGTNNHVTVTLMGAGAYLGSNIERADSIPDEPLWMNTAVIRQ